MGMMSFNKMRRQNADKAEEQKEAEKPQNKKADNVEDPQELSKEDKKFNALILKLDVLKDKEIEFCAKKLGFEFTTKEETVAKIKEFLGQN